MRREARPPRRGASFVLLARERAGLAAVEFALLAGFSVLLGLSFFDLTSAYILWRRLTQAAQSIGEIATKIAVQPDGTNLLTYPQAVLAGTAVFAIVPGTQAMPAASYGVVMTVVTFTAVPPGCTANCTYTGAARWSASVEGGQPQRGCGAFVSAPDSQSPTATTLPADAFQPSSILLVDVTGTYNPLFLNFITGPLRLTRSAYLPPRSGTLADFIGLQAASVPAHTNGVTICP